MPEPETGPAPDRWWVVAGRWTRLASLLHATSRRVTPRIDYVSSLLSVPLNSVAPRPWPRRQRQRLPPLAAARFFENGLSIVEI